MTDVEEKKEEPKRLPQPLELMHPHSVVLDVVLTWADTIGEQGRCKVVYTPEADTWSLLMGLRNHLNEKFLHGVVVHFDGEPVAGTDPRFMLRKLGPGVWKLSPSILAPKIHAYVTLIGVPEPAPWEGPAKKTAKIQLDSIKDPDGWHNLIHELGLSDVDDAGEDRASTEKQKFVEDHFEFGEYASLELVVDEDLNVVGGRIL